jgi:hypothetical protein
VSYFLTSKVDDSIFLNYQDIFLTYFTMLMPKIGVEIEHFNFIALNDKWSQKDKEIDYRFLSCNTSHLKKTNSNTKHNGKHISREDDL